MIDYTNYPRTRKAAKEQGAKFYFTGEPCVRGHVALRATKGVCIECRKEDDLKSREKRAAYFDAYQKSDRAKAHKRAYYERNRDKIIEAAQRRPDEVKRLYRKTYKKNNPDQVQVDNNTRRRRLRECTPPWLTATQKLEIREVYALARKLTRDTGIKYTVDHIVPINGEDVCGLHVPWNLMPMPHVENAKKGNRHSG